MASMFGKEPQNCFTGDQRKIEREVRWQREGRGTRD